MAEAALLVLIDEMKAFAHGDDTIFVVLTLVVELGEVLVGELTLEEVTVLVALVIVADDDTDLFDSTANEFF